MKLLILNGPNLNLLGSRETEIYGDESFESFFEFLQQQFPTITLHYFQSNHEGDLIDQLQDASQHYDGIILNAGAYTHTSVAIADAIIATTVPVIEVHLSNIYARESFRHQSYLSPYCEGIIVGMGLRVYELAVRYFL